MKWICKVSSSAHPWFYCVSSKLLHKFLKLVVQPVAEELVNGMLRVTEVL